MLSRGQQPIKIAYKIYKSQDFQRCSKSFKDLEKQEHTVNIW